MLQPPGRRWAPHSLRAARPRARFFSAIVRLDICSLRATSRLRPGRRGHAQFVVRGRPRDGYLDRRPAPAPRVPLRVYGLNAASRARQAAVAPHASTCHDLPLPAPLDLATSHRDAPVFCSCEMLIGGSDSGPAAAVRLSCSAHAFYAGCARRSSYCSCDKCFCLCAAPERTLSRRKHLCGAFMLPLPCEMKPRCRKRTLEQVGTRANRVRRHQRRSRLHMCALVARTAAWRHAAAPAFVFRR